MIPILVLFLLAGCSPEWRMTADRERDCNAMPGHLWAGGECRRVR